MLNLIKKIFCSHRYQFHDNYEKWDGNPPYDCYKRKLTIYKCVKCNKEITETQKVYL